MHYNYDFNLYSTLNSGQYFLWEKKDGSWYGIYGDTILKITIQKNNGETTFEYESFPRRKNWQGYIFRLDDKYNEIIKEISAKDSVINEIIRKYPGLRIMRQNPFQCILSFLCSSNNNIPRIRKILIDLSKKFGKKVEWDGHEFYTFPTLGSLYNVSIADLLSCGLGYRAKFVSETVKKIVEKKVDMKIVKEENYDKAKQEILKLNGVGEKIADCILLFSFNKLEAFPIDIWISKLFNQDLNRILKMDFKINGKITPNQYKFMSTKIREHYGKYSGYAQQYLYYNIREKYGRRW